MAFMFQYLPRENCLHFFTCLFLTFALAGVGSSMEEKDNAIPWFFGLTAISIGASHLAHVLDWEEFKKHYVATVLSWVTTSDAILVMITKLDLESTPEVLSLFLFGICIVAGIVVYYGIIALNEYLRGQESEVSFRELGLGAGFCIAMFPPIAFALEEADAVDVSLGWPKPVYVVVTGILAAVGAAIAALSRPDLFQDTTAHVVSWAVAAVGAMLSMAVYVHFSGHVIYLAIMAIFGGVGALVGLPVYTLVTRFRRPSDYLDVEEEEDHGPGQVSTVSCED